MRYHFSIHRKFHFFFHVSRCVALCWNNDQNALDPFVRLHIFSWLQWNVALGLFSWAVEKVSWTIKGTIFFWFHELRMCWLNFTSHFSIVSLICTILYASLNLFFYFFVCLSFFARSKSFWIRLRHNYFVCVSNAVDFFALPLLWLMWKQRLLSIFLLLVFVADLVNRI